MLEALFRRLWSESRGAELTSSFRAGETYPEGDQVRFLGVAVSLNQTPARVKAYAERHQLPIEVLWDVEGKAADAYRAPATSYVVVVDKAGKVVYTGVGGKQDLDGAIRKALTP